MSNHAGLFERIRGEYREMPGLRLTLPQAARLWQMEQAVCEALLDVLVQERFLNRTGDGAYIALPSPRRPLAATPPVVYRRSA